MGPPKPAPGSDRRVCRRGTLVAPWPARGTACPTCTARSAGATAAGSSTGRASTPAWPTTWTGSATGSGPPSSLRVPPEPPGARAPSRALFAGNKVVPKDEGRSARPAARPACARPRACTPRPPLPSPGQAPPDPLPAAPSVGPLGGDSRLRVAWCPPAARSRRVGRVRVGPAAGPVPSPTVHSALGAVPGRGSDRVCVIGPLCPLGFARPLGSPSLGSGGATLGAGSPAPSLWGHFTS